MLCCVTSRYLCQGSRSNFKSAEALSSLQLRGGGWIYKWVETHYFSIPLRLHVFPRGPPALADHCHPVKVFSTKSWGRGLASPAPPPTRSWCIYVIVERELIMCQVMRNWQYGAKAWMMLIRSVNFGGFLMDYRALVVPICSLRNALLVLSFEKKLVWESSDVASAILCNYKGYTEMSKLLYAFTSEKV